MLQFEYLYKYTLYLPEYSLYEMTPYQYKFAFDTVKRSDRSFSAACYGIVHIAVVHTTAEDKA